MKELYEKYKGFTAEADGVNGIICGYNNEVLILGLEEYGWKAEFLWEDDIVKETYPFYWYVSEDNIIKQE